MRKLEFQKIRLRIFMDLINKLNLTMDKWIDTYSKKMGADNCITLSSDLLVASALFLSKVTNNSHKELYKTIVEIMKQLK